MEASVTEPDRRAHPRRELTGKAFWSSARREGSCTLRNISMGGAQIERPDMLLTVGQEFELRIDFGDEVIATVHASVVRFGAGTVAFRFARIGKEFLEILARSLDRA
jgi:hypothetical protein